MTIPREEFNAAMNLIHKKLDDNKDHFNERMNSLSNDVVGLRTKIDMTTIPEIPTRPCPFFEDHQKDHQAVRFVIFKSVVGAIISSIAAAIGTVLFFNHHKGS